MNSKNDKSLPEACRECSCARRQKYSGACPAYGDFGCGLYFEQHPETHFKKTEKKS